MSSTPEQNSDDDGVDERHKSVNTVIQEVRIIKDQLQTSTIPDSIKRMKSHEILPTELQHPPLGKADDVREKFVQSGQMLIIYNKKVYKLNKWIKYHPGGDLAILHMIGKDATDEINAFHPEYVTNKKIHSFYVGEYTENDAQQSLPIENGLSFAEEQSISESYRKLESKIKELGLYDCNYWYYALEASRYVLLITSAWLLVIYGTQTIHYFLKLGPIESFPRKMTRTTMDVDCPWWMDWFHGGLQYQTIHHLFPRVPRHNLRKCQPLIKHFCKEVGIEYHLYGFIKGNEMVLGVLRDVSNQLNLLGKVAKSHADRHLMEMS
ncbi:1672_t:CDS:2, partial [Acaulospora colombiana]